VKASSGRKTHFVVHQKLAKSARFLNSTRASCYEAPEVGGDLGPLTQMSGKYTAKGRLTVKLFSTTRAKGHKNRQGYRVKSRTKRTTAFGNEHPHHRGRQNDLSRGQQAYAEGKWNRALEKGKLRHVVINPNNAGACRGGTTSKAVG